MNDRHNEQQSLFQYLKNLASCLRKARQTEPEPMMMPLPALNEPHLTDSSAHEAWIVSNINKLHELKVSDVMTPRANIVAVDYVTPLNDLLQLVVANPFSRLPVYRDNLDEVIGIIHIKDILDSLVTQEEFDLPRLIRKTKIVVPSMSVLDLLLEMRLTRVHMAMVIDEYGGIDGLVTIEDLLEQIVGDIEDERDLEPPHLIPLMEGAWLADGRLPLAKLRDAFGDILSEEDIETSDTLAGLIAALAERVPQRGETIHHPSGLEFDILEADKRRVLRVRVRKMTAKVN